MNKIKLIWFIILFSIMCMVLLTLLSSSAKNAYTGIMNSELVYCPSRKYAAADTYSTCTKIEKSQDSSRFYLSLGKNIAMSVIYIMFLGLLLKVIKSIFWLINIESAPKGVQEWNKDLFALIKKTYWDKLTDEEIRNRIIKDDFTEEEMDRIFNNL